MKKLLELVEEIRNRNFDLVDLLNKLQPADYNYYLPIVQKTIAENNVIIHKILTPQS